MTRLCFLLGPTSSSTGDFSGPASNSNPAISIPSASAVVIAACPVRRTQRCESQPHHDRVRPASRRIGSRQVVDPRRQQQILALRQLRIHRRRRVDVRPARCRNGSAESSFPASIRHATSRPHCPCAAPARARSSSPSHPLREMASRARPASAQSSCTAAAGHSPCGGCGTPTNTMFQFAPVQLPHSLLREIHCCCGPAPTLPSTTVSDIHPPLAQPPFWCSTMLPRTCMRRNGTACDTAHCIVPPVGVTEKPFCRAPECTRRVVMRQARVRMHVAHDVHRIGRRAEPNHLGVETDRHIHVILAGQKQQRVPRRSKLAVLFDGIHLVNLPVGSHSKASTDRRPAHSAPGQDAVQVFPHQHTPQRPPPAPSKPQRKPFSRTAPWIPRSRLLLDFV